MNAQLIYENNKLHRRGAEGIHNDASADILRIKQPSDK